MRLFKLDKKGKWTIVCEAKPTRNGFEHVATLVEGCYEIDSTKIFYLNRTWEAWRFQSVILQLIDKTTYLTNRQKAYYKKKFKENKWRYW